MILSLPKEPSLLHSVSLSPCNTKESLKHNKFIYILVCREKQPHKKDRIFFLKIDNYKNKSTTFFLKIASDFVPGRPGTEEFVPGHLLLPLSRPLETLICSLFNVSFYTHVDISGFV